MSALHGNTHLLGLRDNQFTWQHRAKNIWTALKITGEREKREGALSSHTFVRLKMVLQRWGRIKGVYGRKEDNIRVWVCVSKQDRFMQEEER